MSKSTEVMQTLLVRAGADLIGAQAVVEGMTIEDGHIEYSLRRELEDALKATKKAAAKRAVDAAQERVLELSRERASVSV
jgi:hypothetical protein